MEWLHVQEMQTQAILCRSNLKSVDMKKKIIFLDFDGIMETVFQLPLEDAMKVQYDKYGPMFDEECINNLRLIISATNAEIVVASSWKLNLSLKDLQGMWQSRRLPGTVIDSTPNINFMNDTEIDSWLYQHEGEVDNYVILDDMSADNFSQPLQSHFFHVNPSVGLNREIAEEVIRFLSE